MDARARLLLQQRLAVSRTVAWLVIGGLVAFYGHVQLGLRSRFRERALEQAVKNRAMPAPRGIIYDRNGHKLVDNRRALHLVIQREDIPTDATAIADVAVALELDPDLLRRKIAFARNAPGNRMVILQDNLDEAAVAKAELLRARFPFLTIDVAPRRTYLGSDLAGHALGYVGEVSPDQIEKDPKRFQSGEIIGQAGFEAGRNELLKGLDGSRRILVNNWGREVALYGMLEPKPGTSVYTTLDAGVQQVLKEAFGEEKGAAVVLDLRDGGILGLYSAPSLDPNIFLDRKGRAQTGVMWNDPARPMLNRVTQGLYAPGSTFKLFMALAALDAGKLRPDEVINCPGSFRFGNRSFRCEHVDGGVSLVPAIARSCNVFFYNLGARLDIDDIYKAAERYGLTLPTGIDLPHEKGSRIPNREYKRRVNKTNPANQKWFPGETISVAIGQGDVGLTPIGLARFYAMLATKGKLLTPHLLMGTRDDQTGRVIPAALPDPKDVGLNPQWQAVLEEGLYRVVTEGTAKSARIQGLDMVGKTGTAQVRAQADKSAYSKFEKRFKDHAWFAGYAPRENPQIAFAVIMENAGFGATNAAPVAKKVCEYWFQQRPTKPLPPPTERLEDALHLNLPTQEAPPVDRPAQAPPATPPPPATVPPPESIPPRKETP